MTREEAIYRLKNTAWLGTDKERTETEQAVDMAIEALQAEPTGEYIDKGFELKHYRSMLNKDTPDVTDKDRMNAQIIIEALEMAKTVKVQTQRHGKWIKFEDYLPKRKQNVLFLEQHNELQKYHIGIGTFYGVDDNPYTKDKQDLKITYRQWHADDARIIAWCSLPPLDIESAPIFGIMDGVTIDCGAKMNGGKE